VNLLSLGEVDAPEGTTPPHAGDVILAGKLTATNSDADITVLAPYGKVEVGTAYSPGAPYDSKGGVLTRRGGDIRIMADRNIDLFTSRVFTLQGGDITMWTSDGSITAGSGSKTSVRNVKPSYTMSADGVVAVNVFGLSTGAGIGVLDALEDAGSRPPSRLDLIAPRGEVNAGDAGIRVVGDLNIAAQVVVGVENIQTTGASTGVPKVEVPNIGALTTASQVAQAAAKEGVGPRAVAPKNTLADLPSIITVEVVGYETTEPRDDQAKRKKKGAR
jgi:filamentous hemagglutinin